MNQAASQPQRGSNGVFARLREAITCGDYHFNERLPSERDLARRFSVARGTIRLALQQLQQANLVRRRFGGGAFVAYNHQLDQEDIAEGTSPLELIETRLAVEPHIVKMVVSNASNRELKQLEDALAQVMISDDPNAFSSADEAFHLLLAHCSQNPLLIWIYQRINNIRAHSQWSERKTNILNREKIVIYNRQHAELLRLIKCRDMQGAANEMITHLNQAKRDLLSS